MKMRSRVMRADLSTFADAIPPQTVGVGDKYKRATSTFLAVVVVKTMG